MVLTPIIPGFAPDPSVVRIGAEFFVVTSSFHMFPGLPIYVSRDLIQWQHIGNAINRASQLQLSSSSTLLHNISGPAMNRIIGTGGLYAPTIRAHNGRTYIVCTNVKHLHPEQESDDKPAIDFQNFIIYTDNIWSGEWSDPVYFDFWGIDPDLFFDDDGRVYISGSSWKTDPGTINCLEIDLETGNKISPEQVIWEGFTKVIPEGPHIYRRGDWYYLLAAEGGTHEDHQLCMARSKSIWGPFETCPTNPVLKSSSSQLHYNYIQHNGHGDLFQDCQGKWWLVFLAVRKDRDERYVMGRETFLLPIQWPNDDSWPVMEMLESLHLAQWKSKSDLTEPSVLRPGIEFLWIRDPDPTSYHIVDGGKTISMKPSQFDLESRVGPVSFIGERQRCLHGQATVTLDMTELDSLSLSSVTAGVAYYKDEHRYARIYYRPSTSMMCFEIKNAGKNPIILKVKEEKTSATEGLRKGFQFRIRYTEKVLKFDYSLVENEKVRWNPLAIVDTVDLTDRDFTGPVLGMFATTMQGKYPVETNSHPRSANVVFSNFTVS
ncbi:glycosyl hydrolase [Penicillium sp. IBT 18751x]|nr:glycosyl hydrolase [Penicillium sp. IBT 18751x]